MHKTLASLCCKFNSTGEVVLQHENARVLKEPLASTRLGHGSPGCSPSRPTYVLMSCSEGCSRDGAVPSDFIALQLPVDPLNPHRPSARTPFQTHRYALIQHCTGPIPDNRSFV